MASLSIGAILEDVILEALVRKDEGNFILRVRSHSSDPYKTVTEGPARLLTNCPEAISLGEVVTERGGDRRNDESWETSSREVRISAELPEGGFVAYEIFRHSTGCQYVGGKHLVPLAGEVPTLEFGSAFARWAESLEKEAYAYLLHRAADKKVRRALAFAAGRAHSFAPHAQRRKTWVGVLRGLGVKGDVSRIIGSVRTATAKAAFRLGWQPSVAQPTFWEGLPAGIVEISLE